MRSLRIGKVTVNIGVGEAGERLEKAEKVLQSLTGHKAVRTISRTTNRDWGLREGMPIGCRVTLRGAEAEGFVKRALWPRTNKVAEWSFDREGNLSFGIADHTGLEGQKYNPDIGVFGMDVSITLERPGFRIQRRRLVTRKVRQRHRVTREEAKAFLKQKFSLEIV